MVAWGRSKRAGFTELKDKTNGKAVDLEEEFRRTHPAIPVGPTAALVLVGMCVSVLVVIGTIKDLRPGEPVAQTTIGWAGVPVWAQRTSRAVLGACLLALVLAWGYRLGVEQVFTFRKLWVAYFVVGLHLQLVFLTLREATEPAFWMTTSLHLLCEYPLTFLSILPRRQALRASAAAVGTVLVVGFLAEVCEQRTAATVVVKATLLAYTADALTFAAAAAVLWRATDNTVRAFGVAWLLNLVAVTVPLLLILFRSREEDNWAGVGLLGLAVQYLVNALAVTPLILRDLPEPLLEAELRARGVLYPEEPEEGEATDMEKGEAPSPSRGPTPAQALIMAAAVLVVAVVALVVAITTDRFRLVELIE